MFCSCLSGITERWLLWWPISNIHLGCPRVPQTVIWREKDLPEFGWRDLMGWDVGHERERNLLMTACPCLCLLTYQDVNKQPGLLTAELPTAIHLAMKPSCHGKRTSSDWVKIGPLFSTCFCEVFSCEQSYWNWSFPVYCRNELTSLTNDAPACG